LNPETQTQAPLQAKREQSGKEEEMEAAAIKIQSRARGIKDRKHAQVSNHQARP
jgi:hypothetical protein